MAGQSGGRRRRRDDLLLLLPWLDGIGPGQVLPHLQGRPLAPGLLVWWWRGLEGHVSIDQKGRELLLHHHQSERQSINRISPQAEAAAAAPDTTPAARTSLHGSAL